MTNHLRLAACGGLLFAGLLGCQPSTSPPATPNPAPAPPESAAGAEETLRPAAERPGADSGEPASTDIVLQPAKSLLAVKHRVIFEIQIPQAMSLYQASEGRLPATHDEFMQRIIQANQIQLPELPAGQEYVYDPEQGELMVRSGKTP